MTRTFEDKPATRAGGIPLLLGLMGPSGGGKTFSALRLATGIQRVSGGEIFVIDTENMRSLHYADRFNFRHVPFDPPFDSLSYLAAARHCVDRGAKVVIIDSMSHEHEGEGGLLEQHSAECERLQAAWSRGGSREVQRESVQFSAWAAPKQARRRMVNSFLQMNAHFIFCFRAEEKSKPGEKKKELVNVGYVPIAGKSLVFEMTSCALLLPNAGGVPTWRSDLLSEREMIKRPQQFAGILSGDGPLSEDTGEAMARWASGDTGQAHRELAAAIAGASTQEQLDALVPRLRDAKTEQLVTPSEYESLRSAFGEQKHLMKGSSAAQSEPQSAPEPDDRDPDDPENY